MATWVAARGSARVPASAASRPPEAPGGRRAAEQQRVPPTLAPGRPEDAAHTAPEGPSPGRGAAGPLPPLQLPSPAMVSASTAASSQPAGLADSGACRAARSPVPPRPLPGGWAWPATWLAGVLEASRLPRPKRRSGAGQRPSGENLLPALELLSRCPPPLSDCSAGTLGGRPAAREGRPSARSRER